MSDQTSVEAVTTILPRRGWFDWRLAQLWRYRDLVSLFIWRDFVAVYKQTALGPVWHILKPLLTSFVYMGVFAGVAKLSTDNIPSFLFYFSGTMIWTYFATCLDNIAKAFVANSHLLGKVYFPRLSIPASLVASNLVSFSIQFVMFLLVLAGFWWTGSSVHLTAWALLLPALVAILAGFALGFGAMLCAMTTRYRDFTYLVTFGTTLLMYMTPVIYPTSAVPHSLRWAAELNPLTPVIEAFRLGFLGAGTVSPIRLVFSALAMVVVLVVGIAMFSRAEQTAVDTL